MISPINFLTRKKYQRVKVALVLLALISFLGNIAVSPGLLLQPCYGSTLTHDEMTSGAIDFINNKYQSGEALDGYTAYVLNLAGEDLAADEWSAGNKTMKERIENLADLLGDSNSFITYITSTQNSDGSFGPYANEYGTKAPLQALAAAKADTVDLAVYGQVNRSIELAVSYFKNGYQNGSMPYAANGWSFDYRCVEALVASGEDLSVGSWVYDGSSLEEAAVASALEAAANPAAQDAVYLAKELTVLRAVYPTSPAINTLADTIIAKKDTSSLGQISFGSSIYDDVVVLTALGKAGRLGDIEQSEALHYLSTFKHVHYNSWGMPAGAAWGGYYPEEPDLTAQVITALSYFNEAVDSDSDVYNSIQDGLAYLSDIQNPDTAAITAEWDSTFATAETLIALKSLGKNYDEYAGQSSGWQKKSRTKTVAQCLLAVSGWNDDTNRDRLADLLADRQITTGPGQGSFENSVYSDMWAFIALGEAGQLSAIDTVYARDYILSKQGADGSWGECFGSDYYADFLSTTQAIQALTYMPEASGQQVQASIDNGLAYLKGLQQADGGVYSTWDDPAIDNSELIVTLCKLEQDPSSSVWKNTSGLTPLDYLLNNTMNPDGSFGTAGNVYGAVEALYALCLTTGQGGSGGGGGQIPPDEDKFRVKIAVVGMNGELLYGPDSVTVSTDGQWGTTALGALDATGLDYKADRNSGFVSRIAGQANSGMNGWMFKINGVVAMVAGKDKQVRAGDQIIWWYSEDMNSKGPDWSSLQSGSSVSATTTGSEGLPEGLSVTKEALSALNNLSQLLGLPKDTTELGPLGETDIAVAVLGTEKLPARSAFLTILKKLAGNSVDLSQEVAAATDAVIADKSGEIGLIIPDEALKEKLKITIKKDSAGESGTFPASYRQIAPVYSLGPDNTHFAEPVTLALRIAIPPLVKPENLVLARYNKAKGTWFAVPAVVDAGNGVLLSKISYLAEYTVLVRQERKSFNDVSTDTCDWAVEPVELLAGAGVVDGIDGIRYEPDRSMTRAELTSILVRALRLPAATSQTAFTDVPEQEWYAGCIAAASQAGLVKGDDDGAFRPDGMVTREELAAVLARGLNLTPQPGANPPFTDTGEISAWARESLTALSAAGLAQGYPDGCYRPHNTVTRAECAVLVYRALNEY